MLGLGAAAFLTGSLALAATQGTLGSTSSGTMNINSTKGNAVMISGLADITFPASFTAPISSIDQTACIYSTTGNYLLTATSANANGTTFQLANGGNQIIYTVAWSVLSSGGTLTTLASGQQSGTTFVNANQSSTSCNGGNDSHVEITIDAGTFNSAPTGSYTDTLTFTVAPI
jgi:hypothetical protein